MIIILKLHSSHTNQEKEYKRLRDGSIKIYMQDQHFKTLGCKHSPCWKLHFNCVENWQHRHRSSCSQLSLASFLSHQKTVKKTKPWKFLWFLFARNSFTIHIYAYPQNKLKFYKLSTWLLVMPSFLLLPLFYIGAE